MVAEVFQALKESHPYQTRVLLFCSLLTLVSNVIQMCIPILIQEPIVLCQYPSLNTTDTPEYFECSMKMACSGEYSFIIDRQHSVNSLATDFSLVCEDNYKAEFVGSASFLGKLTGFFHSCFIDLTIPLAGPLLYVSIAIGFVSAIGAFSVSVEMYWVIMVVWYHLNSCLTTYAFSHSVDIVKRDPVLREVCVQIVYLGWSLSCVYGSALAYVSADWRLMTGVYTAIPMLLLCLVHINLKKQYEEFKKEEERVPFVLNPRKLSGSPSHQHISPEQMLASLNNLVLDSHEAPLEERDEIKKEQPEPTLMDVFKDGELIKITVCNSILEVIVSLVYYGAHLAVAQLIGDIYLNLILIGLMEAIAYLTSAVINTQFMRKPTLYTLFILSFLVYSSFIFIGTKNDLDDDPNADPDEQFYIKLASSVLIIVGKWMNTTAYGCFHAHLAELVPTQYMAAVYSIVSFIGAFSLVFIPQIISMIENLGLSVYVVFGVINLFAIFAVIPLRETKVLREARKKSGESELAKGDDSHHISFRFDS